MLLDKTVQISTDRPLIATPELQLTNLLAGQDRLKSVTKALEQGGCDAVLLYDPVNIRYATDTSNMQIWTMHNFERYALVFVDGYVVLWDFFNCDHLSEANCQVDEIRTAISWSFFSAGDRAREKAKAWADEINDVLRQRLGDTGKLAIDWNISETSALISAKGHTVVEGESLMGKARLVKSDNELALMQYTIDICEIGIQRMHDELKPGMSENELWAYLHFENIKHGGEWIETRIMSSGPRTNPWMQESSSRIMQKGEIVNFDTDLVGPFGYLADISRAWTVGHTKPTDEQRKLYSLAHEQIQTNQTILKAGMSYREFSELAWKIPEKYYANRYCVMAHGVGMADENPAIMHAGADWQNSGYDGIFKENMVMCIESYIGEAGAKQGIKLEEQVVVTADGVKAMSHYPFEEHWL
jgi:Xaa-Pro dipeptidase